MNVDSRYNCRLRLIGLEKMWSWHPCSLILVKKNSSDDDKQSAESTGLKLGGLKYRRFIEEDQNNLTSGKYALAYLINAVVPP